MFTDLGDSLGFACFDDAEDLEISAHARQFFGEFVVHVHEDAGAGRQVLDERCERLAAHEGPQGVVVETVLRGAEEDDL